MASDKPGTKVNPMFEALLRTVISAMGIKPEQVLNQLEQMKQIIVTAEARLIVLETQQREILALLKGTPHDRPDADPARIGSAAAEIRPADGRTDPAAG